MTTHSSILAWRIPWTEEPGRLQSMGLKRVRHYLTTKQQQQYTFSDQIRSDQSLSHVRLFVAPWTAAHQASLSITNSRSLLKLMPIELVMPSNHLILCCPLLPTSTFPSIRVFSKESALPIRWPKYWSFSFSISPSNDYSGLFPLGLTGLTSFQSKELSKVFSGTTIQKHQFFSAQLSLRFNSNIHT